MKLFSEISLFWLIPWAVLSIIIGLWYYRNQKQLVDVSKGKIRLLTGLRSFSIFLLGLILFGILIETIDSKTEKPVFITLIDNSASMLNYKDSSEVEKKVKDYYTNLESQFGDRFDIVNYTIDNDVKQGKAVFTGKVSNLNKGFDFVFNQYYNRNIGGICFISDGNYNKGNNPVYTAEKINLTPIFSVGVGDTIPKKDHLISNVTANNIAFFGNKFPVDVDVKAFKMGVKNYNLSLYSNGSIIAKEKVKYLNGSLDFEHVSFTIEASTIGFVSYTVRLEEVNGEYTLENNERTFYVEIIDSRSKVLFLANSPHPDITALKQVIGKDKNIEVDFSLISEWDGNTDGVELVVLFGVGDLKMTSTIRDIQKKNIPSLYFVSNKASKNEIDKLNISLSLPSGRQLDQVQGYLKEGFNLFEVSDELKDLMKKAPPIHVKFGQTEFGKGNVLISQRIGQVEKTDPILYFGKSMTNKFGVFVGEGLWRWKLFEYSRKKDNKGFEELINKTVQYLIVKNNKESLQINLPKRFNTLDEIILDAEFYNATLELITTPDILFEVVNEKNDKINYEFAKNGKGYNLSLGKLDPGKYNWTASTNHDGKKYKRTGMFIVEDVSFESLTTKANHNVLIQIAQHSNGSFYKLNELDVLFKDIAKRKDIVNLTYEESVFSDLVDLIWLFVLIVLSLSFEWFLRRYSGSY